MKKLSFILLLLLISFCCAFSQSNETTELIEYADGSIQQVKTTITSTDTIIQRSLLKKASDASAEFYALSVLPAKNKLARIRMSLIEAKREVKELEKAYEDRFNISVDEVNFERYASRLVGEYLLTYKIYTDEGDVKIIETKVSLEIVGNNLRMRSDGRSDVSGNRINEIVTIKSLDHLYFQLKINNEDADSNKQVIELFTSTDLEEDDNGNKKYIGQTQLGNYMRLKVIQLDNE